MGVAAGIPLTKRVIEQQIRETVSAGVERWIWDARAIGLGVRIKPTERATFVLRYRNSEGRLRKYAIGAFGPFTVESARAQAFQLIAAIKGVEKADPAASRRTSHSGTTVSELCEQYLTNSQNTIRQSTLAMDRSRIEVHVKPLLGARKVAGIKPTDIEQLINNIIAGKTATAAKRKGRGGNARGGKGVAIRTARMLAVIFKRAVRDGLLDANPVPLVKRPAEDRYRPIFSWDAYERLGTAWRALASKGVNASALNAIWLLALTGARRSEILELQWSSVDVDRHCLHLSATKTIAQDRPIGTAAIQIFNGLIRNGPCVFPGGRPSAKSASGKPFVGLFKIWRVLRKRAGMPDLHLHGLRHFFASAAHACGYSKFTVAGLLGHSVGGDTERYVSVIDATLIEAANRTSQRIWEVLHGEDAPRVQLAAAQSEVAALRSKSAANEAA